MKNIFVLGPDEINLRTLEKVGKKMGVRFHKLLEPDEVALATDFDFENLMDRAQRQLDRFEGSVDGILGLWDFPSSLLQPLLARENNLPGAAPEAVLKCEHKYYSRKIQKRVVPQMVPDFQIIDPFKEAHEREISLEFPFWLKPIKAHSSALGFYIENESDLENALPKIRKGIGRLGKPFTQSMRLMDTPPAYSELGGLICIAEGIIDGKQCTAEGFVQNGEIVIYGIIDSHRYEGASSFQRYEYPSRLPHSVKERIEEASRAIIGDIGLDQSCFNIEYFYDEDTEELWLLEINPRCSQSHADIFLKVDGMSNQEVSASLCLGREVDWKSGDGEFGVASKFFLRYFEDGFVKEMPDPSTVEELMQEQPDSFIDLQASEGKRLSDQVDQDSYSYEVARIYLGADDRPELFQRYEETKEALEEEIEIS